MISSLFLAVPTAVCLGYRSRYTLGVLVSASSVSVKKWRKASLDSTQKLLLLLLCRKYSIVHLNVFGTCCAWSYSSSLPVSCLLQGSDDETVEEAPKLLQSGDQIAVAYMNPPAIFSVDKFTCRCCPEMKATVLLDKYKKHVVFAVL